MRVFRISLVMSSEHRHLTLPPRFRFTWGIETVLWTDGKRDQTRYVQAVQHWSKSHDNVPLTNRNRIDAMNRCVVLSSHLFGDAADLYRTMQKDDLDVDDGTAFVEKRYIGRKPCVLSPTSTFSYNCFKHRLQQWWELLPVQIKVQRSTTSFLLFR